MKQNFYKIKSILSDISSPIVWSPRYDSFEEAFAALNEIKNLHPDHVYIIEQWSQDNSSSGEVLIEVIFI